MYRKPCQLSLELSLNVYVNVDLFFFGENKVQIRKLCAIIVANYMQAWENKQLIALS